jgi:RNA polymerase sigma-70 factor (ECF subfamily)
VIDAETERSWKQDALGGSALAFSRLVEAHQSDLRAFLRRLCNNNWAEADDLAQETFAFAWFSMARFNPESSFRGWLFGIGWRKFRERRRSWLRLVRREQAASFIAGKDSPVAPGLKLDLASALGQLAPEQRAAVMLCLAYGFSHAEAAETLRIPAGTVKSQVLRGRTKLLAILGESHGYD